MYHVKISLQNKRTLKERLIKVRAQPATPTTRRASSVAASGAKAPATRGNLLECVPHSWHNVSGAKAPATRGNSLECVPHSWHNVSGAKAPAM